LCINFATGEQVWSGGRGPGGGSAAILLADGHLYFRYEDGTMALIEATPEEYRLKGSFKLKTNNGKSWPHPVIVDGLLYARDQNALLCYDIRK
jgi:outer membrane protein assembly factor BamB